MYIISGIYFAPGKEVPGGERKLYVAIERGRQHRLIDEKVPWSRAWGGKIDSGKGSYSNRGALNIDTQPMAEVILVDL